MFKSRGEIRTGPDDSEDSRQFDYNPSNQNNLKPRLKNINWQLL